MLTLFHFDQGILQSTPVEGPLDALPEQTVWIDIVGPRPEDEAAMLRLLSVELPTHEEMQEIEASSRLYEDGGALVMTMPVLSRALTDEPEAAAITFILAGSRLITVRYVEPLPFAMFQRRLARQPALVATGEAAMVGLMEQIADRLADVLESATADLESISRDIFRKDAVRGGDDLKDILQRVGRAGDLATKAKDSLLGLSRVLLFLGSQTGIRKDSKVRMKTLMRDANSIAEHATFLSTKVAFLLDATLGMINIEQNNVIKILTVASVAFLPPMLIASMYGMNFAEMPELHWRWGYPVAVGAMFLSAIAPFLYFRSKKWL
ncbi:Mg2+ and Co2+ transporters [uncultured Alphaproteobacteria bacterium]|uniref:Magnesium transport protein CorA n=1 Tax=uncultured Alphaproteobacteria bacterium TaxID=91750 RepID=A0A212JBH2_9PROT|nr:Mg2+ and Co2+ transporters [uncultured Alphaproteobacteria bacterium]